jgi:hypothetical protein
MVLPALLLLLSLLFSVLGALSLQVRCREVATSIAKSIERGEDESSWRQWAAIALPEADVQIEERAGVVVISVRHPSPMHFPVEGEAVAIPR